MMNLLVIAGSAFRQTRIVSEQVASMWPLQVHASGRYLVDGQGKPFIGHGDTVWTLPVNASDAEIEQYLDDRQARGFNTILVTAIDKFGNLAQPYRNRDSVDPFSNMSPVAWASPTTAYWDRVVLIVDEAKARDMLVIINPCYFGFLGGGEGWWSEMNAGSDAALYDYGEYLGARFDQGNIMWCWGGDYDGNSSGRAKQRQILAGIRSVRTTDLNSFHPAPNKNATDVISPSDYPNFVNWVYAYEKDGTYPFDLMADAYAEAGPHPAWFMEGQYEGEHSTSAATLRRQSYSTLAAGGCGQLFGNNPIWLWDSGWEAALNSTGSQQQEHVAALLASLDWHLLEPKTDTSLVTSSKGGTTSPVCPALSSDATFGVCYVPGAQTVTFNLNALTGVVGQVRGRIYSVTAGTYSSASGSPYTKSSSQGIATSADCVIVLDEEPA